MIALNELLENIDAFKSAYGKLGFRCNPEIFIALENARKEIQLKCESAKAECNKKCTEIAKLKREAKDTKPVMEEILRLDDEANRLKKALDKKSSEINCKLRKLRNLPDQVILEREVLETHEKSGAMSDKYSCFYEKSGQKQNVKIKQFLKGLKGVVFAETELPKLVCCKDGFAILLKDYETDEMIKRLIEFFKHDAKTSIRKKSGETRIYSADEYLFEFEDGTVEVELVREFFTREFSIKYRNKSIDATKFVNQINIKKR